MGSAPEPGTTDLIPRWSPDGTLIAYLHVTPQRPNGEIDRELADLAAVGGYVTAMTEAIAALAAQLGNRSTTEPLLFGVEVNGHYAVIYSPYGLAGGVWSADPERAKRVARRIRTGQLDINGGSFNTLAPFGGYKQSGHGRELGRYGLEEFLEIKSLQL